jgi:hypothetical protein
MLNQDGPGEAHAGNGFRHRRQLRSAGLSGGAPFRPFPQRWRPGRRTAGCCSSPSQPPPMVSIQIGRTYVVPLSPGRMFPRIPAGGFRSAADLAKIPGVKVIDADDVAPGPTPGVYTFSRATVLRNLYTIPIP